MADDLLGSIALQAKGEVILYGKATQVDIDLDTCAEVNIVSLAWAKEMNLKRYVKTYPQTVLAVGMNSVKVWDVTSEALLA